MTRGMLYVLLTLSTLTVATVSAFVPHDGQSSTVSIGDVQDPSQNPPPSRVTTRALDVPPPPLSASRIRNPHVTYVPSYQLKTYPVPAIIFRREGLARESDRSEIIEKIVYPAINKSDKPIAAIVVEFFRDRTDIGVTLIWYGVGPTGTTNYSSASIDRNKTGHFAADSYLRLFPEDEK